ncbi:MAG: hypothetical protein JNL08_04135 [Planctomycetes bacterium]|nr:hypothetical protein [Planctomycetota bacterium]
MKLPIRAALAAGLRDLGPLWPIAVYVAVAQTAGGIAALAVLSVWSPAAPLPPMWLPMAAISVAAATALAVLPPAAAAFVAGYAFGGVPGAAVAAVGTAVGAVLARALVWPRLGAARFAFMRERPRAVAVRRACGDGRAARGVVMLRLAAPFPFAVQNLLLAVAPVPVAAVGIGTLFGVLPVAVASAWAGALLRAARQDSLPPASAAWFGAALLAALAVHAGRRQWRRAGAAADG